MIENIPKGLDNGFSVMLSDVYSTDGVVVQNLWKLAYKKLWTAAASKPDVVRLA